MKGGGSTTTMLKATKTFRLEGLCDYIKKWFRITPQTRY